MKNKLRRITVNNSAYLYSVVNKYQSETGTNTLTIKVYLEGQKQTPLIIEFLTIDHYYMGQLLKSGASLINVKTNTTDSVNLNEPKYIREFILQGVENGWAGSNKLATQNGLNYLAELGYETNILKPQILVSQ